MRVFVLCCALVCVSSSFAFDQIDLQPRIDAAAAAGGGRVVVEKGG